MLEEFNKYLDDFYKEELLENYDKEFIDSLDINNGKKVLEILNKYNFYFIEDIILNRPSWIITSVIWFKMYKINTLFSAKAVVLSELDIIIHSLLKFFWNYIIKKKKSKIFLLQKR